jgi:hypothetical protein
MANHKWSHFPMNTFESQGFVANLSRCSPLSSNKWMTLSAVTNANLRLFGDHAMACICASPPYL